MTVSANRTCGFLLIQPEQFDDQHHVAQIHHVLDALHHLLGRARQRNRILRIARIAVEELMRLLHHGSERRFIRRDCEQAAL